MAPKNTLFSREKDCQLILLTQQHRLLWDTTIAEYCRTDLKRQHWDEIAKELGPEFTGEMVLKRFQNMENTFRANEMKMRESNNRCSGVSADDVYKPKWEYYDMLSFLRKTCIQSGSMDNLCTTNEHSSNMGSQHVNQLPCSFSQGFVSGISFPTAGLNMYFDDNLQKFITLPADTYEGDQPPGIQEGVFIPSCNRSLPVFWITPYSSRQPHSNSFNAFTITNTASLSGSTHNICCAT